MKKQLNWKLPLGLAVSALFLWLAFARVDLGAMGRALRGAAWIWLLPAGALLFASHWLRSLRWRYLLEPVQRVPLAPLFSALLIGYMFNTFLPAHLGELVRANLLGRKRGLAPSAVLASVVIERLIDVFTLLALLGLTVWIFPFPGWVRSSGLAILAGALPLFLLLVVMRRQRRRAMAWLAGAARILPRAWRPRLLALSEQFLDGLVPLARWYHYPLVAVLSLLIWLGYAVAFRVLFRAFAATAGLGWTAALVLLVITTISVLVPSSPGYVGTYHFLCKLSLLLFAVPADAALSFAFVMHGLNFFPVLLAGLGLVLAGGMRVGDLRRDGAARGGAFAAAGGPV